MIIKTKEFKEAASTILIATSVDRTGAANLELVAKDNNLYLNVTNTEYYCSCMFPLEGAVNFRASVEANVFLNLIAGITTETFDISVTDSKIVVKSGKSSYKVPQAIDNRGEPLVLNPILVSNKTVVMPIELDILKSILNVNAKEIQKAKSLDVQELQRLYYIDETGCFTFTTGACLNKFTLQKPVKLLLNDRIVQLFKLFDADVTFTFGHELLKDGSVQQRVSFETDNIYLSAIVNCDDLLLAKVQGPCQRTKDMISAVYANRIVISANELGAAVNRIITFIKNTVKEKPRLIPATISFAPNELIITDAAENTETITISDDSQLDLDYTMSVNLADIKSITDSCKMEYLTLTFGNHRVVIASRGTVDNCFMELA